MADPPELTPPQTGNSINSASTGVETQNKDRRKKEKVRSAWISFAGRVVAQVIGAMATIGLSVFFVQNYRGSRNPDAESPTLSRSPAATTRTRTPRAGGTAIAVLPLSNLSGDPDQEYFADGITEALIANLARINGLRVISRTSSMQYKGERKALPDIARELDVDFVVEGSVVRSGDRVRTTAQLIDARADEHVWSKSFDRTMRDVLTLQAEIATEVAREVNVVVTTAGDGSMPARAPVDPDAYDLYLKGRQAWNARTASGARDAQRYFEESIRRDPMFALAYAGLADVYNLMPGSGERMAAARAAAARAVELDPNLAEAHASLGTMHHRYDRDIVAAERDFRRALELNPGYANAHQWYAIVLAEERRDPEALRHARQAVSLDPLTPAMRQSLALVHYFGRRFDEAVLEANRALKLQSTLPVAREMLARALVASGAYEEAIQVIEAAPEPPGPEFVGIEGVAHTRRGDIARGDALFRQLQAMRPFPVNAVARWYAATGKGDAALELMQRTRDEWNFQQIKADPVFDSIRDDPRFVALSRQGHR